MNGTARHDDQLAPLLLQLVEYAPDGMALAELDGTLIYVNPTLRSLIGEDEPLNGITIYDLFTDEDEAEHMMEVVHQIAEHDAWHGSLTYQRRHDGMKFKVAVSFIAIRNAENQPQALGAFVRDMTSV